MPAYASLGATATDEVERGYRHVKLHLPSVKEHPDEIVDLVRARRETVGPDVALYLDAAARWDWETSAYVVKACEPFNIGWLEEPLLADDLEGHRRLGEMTTIPIAGGEHEYTLWGYQDLLAKRALSVWQPDACWVGGMTVMRDIFSLGQANGIWVVPHRGSEVWGLHAILALADRPLAEGGRPWVTWVRASRPSSGARSAADRAGLRRRLRRRVLVNRPLLNRACKSLPSLMYTSDAHRRTRVGWLTRQQGGVEQVRGVVPDSGTNGAGKASESAREVYLRVAEAFPFDIHRGIARLDQASFDALGLQPGGLIHLTGKRRTTIRVERSPEGVPGRHVIRLDGTLRDNAQVSIDERVKVASAGPPTPTVSRCPPRTPRRCPTRRSWRPDVPGRTGA